MKQQRWYTKVPAAYVDRHGKPKPLSSNHHLPRYAYLVDHGHTKNEHAVYDFLQRQKRNLGGDLGWIVHGYSVAKIAKGAGMAPQTVRDILRSLARKHSIVAWNAQSGKAEPRRRGDHGGTTAWRLPRYVDVLRARRADPLIGVGGKNNKSCWVFGPGRRFLTPEEVADWGLENYSFEEHGIRSAVLGATEAEFTGPEEGMAPTAAAAGGKSPPRAASPPGKDPMPEPIREYLKKTTKQAYNAKVAVSTVKAARETAAARGYQITDEEILSILKMIATDARKKNKSKQMNVGYFETSIAARVNDWVADRKEYLEKQAVEAPKFAARERESKIEIFVAYLGEIAKPDPTTPELTEMAKQELAAGDPELVAAAQERFSRRATA